MDRTDQRFDARALRTRVFSALPMIAARAAELDALATRTRAPASAYWPALSAWFRARPEMEPLAVLVFAGGHLVGAAILARQRARGVWRVAGAGTTGEPYMMPVESPIVAEVLAQTLHSELESQPGPWKLSLTDLPAADPVVEALLEILPDPDRAEAADSPQLEFDGTSPVNEYLSRNVRSAVAKARNRVARDGKLLELSWRSDAAEIEARIDEIVSVRASRDQQLQRAAHEEAELATFTGTIANQAAAGRVRLLEVRINGGLAAYAVCFLSAGTLWVYSNQVSPEFTRYSAGTIANAEVVRYAHESDEVEKLNWGRGVQRYKLSGPVILASSQSLTAWSSPLTRRLLDLGRALRGFRPGR